MSWLAQHRGTPAEPVWRTIFQDEYGDPAWWNRQPEQATLSLLLLAPERIAEVGLVAEPAHFQDATYSALYGALYGLWRAGRPVSHAAWMARLSPALRVALAGLVVGPWSADELVPCAQRVREATVDRHVAALLRTALGEQPGDRRSVLLRLRAAVDEGLVVDEPRRESLLDILGIVP